LPLAFADHGLDRHQKRPGRHRLRLGQHHQRAGSQLGQCSGQSKWVAVGGRQAQTAAARIQLDGHKPGLCRKLPQLREVQARSGHQVQPRGDAWRSFLTIFQSLGILGTALAGAIPPRPGNTLRRRTGATNTGARTPTDRQPQ